MKFKLRDCFVFSSIHLIGIILGVLCVIEIQMNGQEKQDPPAKTEETQVKTWKLPEYMQENLQRMLDDFNEKFNKKVEAYKKELKTRFAEFRDMPDDTVLYLEGGIFITRSDFSKLQEQLRDKPMKEVKDNETTN